MKRRLSTDANLGRFAAPTQAHTSRIQTRSRSAQNSRRPFSSSGSGSGGGSKVAAPSSGVETLISNVERKVSSPKPFSGIIPVSTPSRPSAPKSPPLSRHSSPPLDDTYSRVNMHGKHYLLIPTDVPGTVELIRKSDMSSNYQTQLSLKDSRIQQLEDQVVAAKREVVSLHQQTREANSRNGTLIKQVERLISENDRLTKTVELMSTTQANNAAAAAIANGNGPPLGADISGLIAMEPESPSNPTPRQTAPRAASGAERIPMNAILDRARRGTAQMRSSSAPSRKRTGGHPIGNLSGRRANQNPQGPSYAAETSSWRNRDGKHHTTGPPLPRVATLAKRGSAAQRSASAHTERRSPPITEYREVEVRRSPRGSASPPPASPPRSPIVAPPKARSPSPPKESGATISALRGRVKTLTERVRSQSMGTTPRDSSATDILTTAPRRAPTPPSPERALPPEPEDVVMEQVPVIAMGDAPAVTLSQRRHVTNLHDVVDLTSNSPPIRYPTSMGEASPEPSPAPQPAPVTSRAIYQPGVADLPQPPSPAPSTPPPANPQPAFPQVTPSTMSSSAGFSQSTPDQRTGTRTTPTVISLAPQQPSHYYSPGDPFVGSSGSQPYVPRGGSIDSSQSTNSSTTGSPIHGSPGSPWMVSHTSGTSYRTPTFTFSPPADPMLAGLHQSDGSPFATGGHHTVLSDDENSSIVSTESSPTAGR